jgi:hypothetical protein
MTNNVSRFLILPPKILQIGHKWVYSIVISVENGHTDKTMPIPGVHKYLYLS